MSNIAQDFVEEYIRGVLEPTQGIVREMEQYAAQNKIPIIHPEVAKLLEVLIMAHNSGRILEIGTAIGYSAIIMAKAAGEKGIVDTIEINEGMISQATEYIRAAGLENRVNVLQGDAREALKQMNGSYDLIFIDGAKGHYEEMFNSSLERLRTGGIIICDNVLFRGMVASSGLVKRRKITIVKRMRKFLKYITSHPRLNTAIIPIGDGLSISCRREK